MNANEHPDQDVQAEHAEHGLNVTRLRARSERITPTTIAGGASVTSRRFASLVAALST